MAAALSTRSSDKAALVARHCHPGEDLADASGASPGPWVDCLLEMRGKETFPSAGPLERSHRMQRIQHQDRLCGICLSLPLKGKSNLFLG